MSSSTLSGRGAMRFTLSNTMEMPPAEVSYFDAYSSILSSGTSLPSLCFFTRFLQMDARWALFIFSKQTE